MERMKKIVSVLLTLAIMATMFSFVLANNYPEIGTVDGDTKTKFDTIAGKILAIVQYVGYAIAIGMLIYIGIKYVSASANEKADLKGGLIKYVIGALIIAGASTLFGIVQSMGSSLSSSAAK